MPANFILENTNICNANCATCPSWSLTRKKQHMDIYLFNKIIMDIKQIKNPHIIFCGYGEPLIDPLIFERLSICRQNNIATSLYTNASLLTQDVSRKLIESGLKHINISFDSLDKHKYEDLRKGLSFEKVLNNIIDFINIRNELAAKTSILITAKDYKMADAAERDNFYLFWKNRLSYKKDRIDVGFTDERKDKKAFGYDVKRKKINFKFPCVYLWTNFTILANGDVVACCFDSDALMVMGNLNKENITDIWKGDKYKNARQAHFSGMRNELSLCRGCYYFPNWWLPY